MNDIFKKYNIEVEEEKLKKFQIYYELLVEYNQKFNITAITEKEEIYVKHFVDSIINVDKLKCGKLLDIGSGGGFPSFPIKIINDEISLTVIESNGKKCEFLRMVADTLQLKNVEIICDRAENVAVNNKYREKFDYCVSRAVARLNILNEYCIPFIKVGGTFIAYKGDASEEIEEGKNSIKVLGAEIENVDNYTIDGAKRTLVYIKKIKNTEKKYPRSNANIRKKPL